MVLAIQLSSQQAGGIITFDTAGSPLPAGVQVTTSELEKRGDDLPPPTFSGRDEQPSAEKQTALLAPAKAALVVKKNAGDKVVVFSRNENDALPIASLTKLMTLLIVLENYELEDVVRIDKEALLQLGEQGELKEDQTLLVKDLIYSMLMESSNRAAYAVAQVLGVEQFVELMNQRAEQLGLSKTHFADVTGLNEKSVSSASDVAKLSAYLFERFPVFGEITALKEFKVYSADGNLHHSIKNTNLLLEEFGEIAAGKTGFTLAAKGCFMVIIQSPESEEYTVYVILGSDDRLAHMRELIIRN